MSKLISQTKKLRARMLGMSHALDQCVRRIMIIIIIIIIIVILIRSLAARFTSSSQIVCSSHLLFSSAELNSSAQFV